MDESAGPDPPRPPPDAAAIRRALAECMTLNDIDDAMGWARGTARRRRWRDPDAGGLPPADAELGGVPLWFRATIADWSTHEHVRTTTGAAEPARREEPVRAAPRHAAPPPPPTPGGAQEGTAADDDIDVDDGSGDTVDDSAPRTDPAAAAPSPPAPAEPEPATDQPGGEQVDTGFALAPGQRVLAFVHGRWHPAVVASRARRTVVVDYQLDPGPLGARRQRVTLERIRLP